MDYWVVKLDSALNIEWQKTIGGTLNDSCNSVVQTKDGGYILGGYSQSNISGEKTENSKGATDYWVVKLTKTGAIQWQKTIGGSAADNLINIIETKKNFYVLAGYSASGISGDKTSPSKGDIDYWIVKLRYTNPAVNDVSNAADALNSNRNFSAGPNPAKNELFVQSTVKSVFSLLNQAGNVLLTKTIEGNGVIDITKLAAGLYYLKNNSTGEAKKIMVD